MSPRRVTPSPHLVVDIGNTRIKWGLCDAASVIKNASLPPDDPAAWQTQLAAWQLTGPLEWAVSGVHPERRKRFAQWCQQRGDKVYVFISSEQLPVHVALEQPAKVGIDRLLNAIAVNTRRSADTPAIIIDAGSAITVDYVDECGVFLGGAILPGPGLMAKALHDYTALLPLVRVDGHFSLPGDNTAEAVKAGIFCAVLGGIREAVQQLHDNLCAEQEAEIYLGGGDSEMLDLQLPHAPLRWPEMTLEGLRLAGWPKRAK